MGCAGRTLLAHGTSNGEVFGLVGVSFKAITMMIHTVAVGLQGEKSHLGTDKPKEGWIQFILT